MVQYQMMILADNSYEKHSKHYYWAILPTVNVPPEWKDVPACIQEEWVKLIPEQGGIATIGGTIYTLEGDLLLPIGQLPHYIMTEDNARIQTEAARLDAERELASRRHQRLILNRRNLVLEGLLRD